MSKSIKISPKHGLNPSIPVCFWCGEEKSEIVLLGRVDKEDSQAPMHMVMNYEPCEKCKKAFSMGIHVIGVNTKPYENGQPPIQEDGEVMLYPSGAFFVATEQWVNRVITNDQDRERILKCGKLLLDDSIVKEIVEQIKDLKQDEG